MSKIDSHRNLIVWQKAMELAVQVYRSSSLFSSTETCRLTAQVTRAAASVPANIAEGHSRAMRRDYAQFWSIAKGSLTEPETFIILAVRLGYVSEQEATPTLALLTEISKMITVFTRKVTRESVTCNL